MRNNLDRPDMREMIGSRNTEQFLDACARSTYGALMEGLQTRPDLNIERALYTCEHSTISATIIWLQERGCRIPADILATLGIDEVGAVDARH